MKKIICSIIAVLFIFGAIPASVMAETDPSDQLVMPRAAIVPVNKLFYTDNEDMDYCRVRISGTFQLTNDRTPTNIDLNVSLTNNSCELVYNNFYIEGKRLRAVVRVRCPGLVFGTVDEYIY